ncbi:MAG: riboflavin synthase [candidate division WOR-3 bacterium]
MFTGLIETVGRIGAIKSKAGSKFLTIIADFAKELRIGDSVAIDGCCLTVIEKSDRSFTVEATAPTLKNTTLKYLKIDDLVNLERSLSLTERMGGHFVLGHIDEVGQIKTIRPTAGAGRLCTIEVSPKNASLLVKNGSIAVAGISLTINAVNNNSFVVNIISHTLLHTTWHRKRSGDYVNIEYDILGKLVQNYLKKYISGSKE